MGLKSSQASRGKKGRVSTVPTLVHGHSSKMRMCDKWGTRFGMIDNSIARYSENLPGHSKGEVSRDVAASLVSLVCPSMKPGLRSHKNCECFWKALTPLWFKAYMTTIWDHRVGSADDSMIRPFTPTQLSCVTSPSSRRDIRRSGKS